MEQNDAFRTKSPLFPQVFFRWTDLKFHILFWVVLHALHFINFLFTGTVVTAAHVQMAFVTTALTFWSTVVFAYGHTYFLLPKTLGNPHWTTGEAFLFYYLPTVLGLILLGAWAFEWLEQHISFLKIHQPIAQILITTDFEPLNNLIKQTATNSSSIDLQGIDAEVQKLIEKTTPQYDSSWKRNIPESAFNIYLLMGFVYLRKWYNMSDALEKEQRLLELEMSQLESENRALEARNKILATEKDRNFYQNQTLLWQIKPHFFFNGLNNIQHKILTNPSNAPDAVVDFSNAMRYVVYECLQEKVPLSKEVDFLKKFIELSLNGYRPESYKLEFKFDEIPPDVEIAPLILVTFVENAIKHGIQAVEKDRWLRLSLRLDGNDLVFKTRNRQSTEQDFDGDPQLGIGIKNTRQRLKIHYPNRHELKLDSEGDTFKVTLKIQL